MRRFITVIFFLLIIGVGYFFFISSKTGQNNLVNKLALAPSMVPTSGNVTSPDPLAIETMRQKSYPGSVLTIEATLTPGLNYSRYLVSFRSDGLIQYGLLTVPEGQIPTGGWPVVLFNHGYISPAQYSTGSSYASFVNPLAAAGYIVFKPDYRGNGKSQGSPVQIYVSSDYLTDSMNALASLKQYKDANPQRIGVFGHSMGGNVTLHELVISKDIKAAAITSGVVGDETDILNWWKGRIKAKSVFGNDLEASKIVLQMIASHGTPSSNPRYWDAIDPTKYIADIAAPIQIQVGTADNVVPPSFSSSFRDKLQSVGKTVDYREYIGADHNLTRDTASALAETVAFFNKYLK